jgi:hypothetical protein
MTSWCEAWKSLKHIENSSLHYTESQKCWKFTYCYVPVIIEMNSQAKSRWKYTSIEIFNRCKLKITYILKHDQVQQIK